MTREGMERSGYHAGFLDVYHFLRRFADRVDDSETFWNAAATEAFYISRKYDGTTVNKFVNGLLSVAYDELKRIRDRKTEG